MPPAKKKARAEPAQPVLEMDPFPRMTWDQYFWTFIDRFPSWKGFQDRRGAYGAMGGASPSNGEATVWIQPVEGPPSAQQIAAFRFVHENEGKVAAAVLRAIFRAYPGLRKEWAPALDPDCVEECLPPIKKAEELRRLIGLSEVHILSTAEAGFAHVGFEFGCSWDEEHGLGVLTHKARIIEVGSADCSFSEPDSAEG